MFFNRNITYLSMYEKEEKINTVGFLCFYPLEQGYRMELQVKGLDGWINGSYPLFIETDNSRYHWGAVMMKRGIIEECKYVSNVRGLALADGIGISVREVCGISIVLSEKCYIKGHWKEKDKWSQLQMQYPQVHPFDNDNEVFLCMTPVDLEQINSSCRKLMNNSFLLHGFYNYRHVIFGKAVEDKTFQLGVPGTYFEREKMVAEMFGFDKFRCEGEETVGKFGYYIKKLKLM